MIQRERTETKLVGDRKTTKDEERDWVVRCLIIANSREDGEDFRVANMPDGGKTVMNSTGVLFILRRVILHGHNGTKRKVPGPVWRS